MVEAQGGVILYYHVLSDDIIILLIYFNVAVYASFISEWAALLSSWTRAVPMQNQVPVALKHLTWIASCSMC